ncbi:hypothetical protein T492DRAFT_934189 [Pavlovales sp. CCMP2436]|nr:hypothetical protein T492DRAFT_934189 [Pavlovales sp. CCMP2436]|mmetsp:Transcript_35620/g.83695  ORF Transcript_35620/g.83695 Transcript_35620/m.83695 type:complete len:172 (+) Transcript_35620:155-670(+)
MPSSSSAAESAAPYDLRALHASLAQAETERDAARAELAAAREAARRSRKQRQALADQLTAVEVQLATSNAERSAGEEGIAAAFSEVVKELQAQVHALTKQLGEAEARAEHNAQRAGGAREGQCGSGVDNVAGGEGAAEGGLPLARPAGSSELGPEKAGLGLAARLRWRGSR